MCIGYWTRQTWSHHFKKHLLLLIIQARNTQRMAFQFSVARMSDTENPMGAVNVPRNDGDVRARLNHWDKLPGPGS